MCLPAILWTSGAVGSPAERKSAREKHAAEEAGETERLRTLKENATLPLLYLDVEVCDRCPKKAGNLLACIYLGWQSQSPLST
jgi:hypothetical protein